MFRELPPRKPGEPRPLTPDMEADASHRGRFLRLFGAIWAGVWLMLSLPLSLLYIPSLDAPPGGLAGIGIAMGLVGALMFGLGAWSRARARDLFRHGEETRGEIVSVEQDTMQRINRRHPWKVDYRYDVAGTTHQGSATYWTDQPPDLPVGSEVLILHRPDRPSQSLLWTAVSEEEGKKRKAAESAAPVRIGAAFATAPYEASEGAAEAEAEAAEEAAHDALATTEGRSIGS